MYAIKRNYPDEFNIVYADANIGPNHVKVADLLLFHRAGHLHDYVHRVMRVWPRTEKRPAIIHDKNNRCRVFGNLFIKKHGR
jgi:hypothetical protein